MTVVVMLALLWAAAIYRVALSVRQPLTVWRTAFTAAVVMATVSMTLWVWRQPLDQALGAPNLTNLLYHATTLAGLVSALIYVESLRHPVIPRRLVLLHVGVGAATLTAMTLAWVAAPVHVAFYADLAPLATVSAVAVYTATFYLFTAWALVRVAAFCFGQGLRRADPARTVSLVLIGSGSGLGALTSSLWAAAITTRFAAHSDPAGLSRAGDLILPVSLIVWGTGIVALFVVSWMLDVVRSYLRLRAQRPAWQSLTDLYPEVRLPAARVWGLRSWLETRERRTAIEIEDALRLHRLQHGPDDNQDDLVHSTHRADRRDSRP